MHTRPRVVAIASGSTLQTSSLQLIEGKKKIESIAEYVEALNLRSPESGVEGFTAEGLRGDASPFGLELLWQADGRFGGFNYRLRVPLGTPMNGGSCFDRPVETASWCESPFKRFSCELHEYRSVGEAALVVLPSTDTRIFDHKHHNRQSTDNKM